jgi:glutaredoxin-related protein
MKPRAAIPARVKRLVEQHEAVVVVSPLTDVRSMVYRFATAGISFKLIEYGMGSAASRREFAELKEATGWNMLPMVFVHGEFIGGYDEYQRWLKKALDGVTCDTQPNGQAA